MSLVFQEVLSSHPEVLIIEPSRDHKQTIYSFQSVTEGFITVKAGILILLQSRSKMNDTNCDDVQRPTYDLCLKWDVFQWTNYNQVVKRTTDFSQ